MTKENIPRTIGFILDGNRRWAKENGLSSNEGHREGAERTKDIARWADEAGVQHLVYYAFSTENWKRSPEEVAGLMQLFAEMLHTISEDVHQRSGRVRFIGERERFSKELQQQMKSIETKTEKGEKGTLWVALSYGGRAEITSAVNVLLEQGREQVTETEIRDAMWSAEMPDPDLIIRTGGEKRLSNFLTWQSTYSELFFTDTKLPAFTKEEFDAILKEYSERERRHGK